MSPRLQKAFLVFSDLLSQILAFAIGAGVLSLYAQYSSAEIFDGWWTTTGEIHTLVHFIFVGLVIFRFYTEGLYSRPLPFWDELRLLWSTLLYLALLNGIIVLIAKWPFSRTLWLTSWTTAAILIPFLRFRTRRILHKRGRWKRPTLMIGVGDTAASTYKALLSEPQLAYQVVDIFGIQGQEQHPDLPKQVPVRFFAREALLRELLALAKINKRLQILIALEQEETQKAAELLENLTLHFDDIHMVPPLRGLPLFGLEVNHFFSHEVLLLRSKTNLSFRPQYALKRAFDIVGAAAITLLVSPILLWIALRIRKSGPVFYIPERLGHDGQIFRCYKFRTMVPNADKLLKDLLENDPVARQEWQEKTKITNDPRITPIGAFLRRTSLDELPQLFNVLKGEMSLVGPRPLAHYEKEKYGARFPFYAKVRPGMTGLWQVSGRSDTDFANRIHLDTWYVKNWSLWYDIAILMKTIRVVRKGSGAY